jgi:predicted phosphodiesterase
VIVIIGDTHGEATKLSNHSIKASCEGEFPQYVIVAGDFGFLWTSIPDDTEKYWLKWFDNKSWTTLFVDGNHESFFRLNNLPVCSMFNSEVGQVSKKVFHLKRGNIYTIENKTFFTFGGAMSIDKENRVEHISWWKEEEPSYVEYNHGLQNLEKNNNKIDYVISHACPVSIFKKIEYLLPFWCKEKINDSSTILLEAYKNKIDYTKWFFGHYHIDNLVDEKHIALYERPYIIQ